jgi:hypothetical protein
MPVIAARVLTPPPGSPSVSAEKAPAGAAMGRAKGLAIAARVAASDAEEEEDNA